MSSFHNMSWRHINFKCPKLNSLFLLRHFCPCISYFSKIYHNPTNNQVKNTSHAIIWILLSPSPSPTSFGGSHLLLCFPVAGLTEDLIFRALVAFCKLSVFNSDSLLIFTGIYYKQGIYVYVCCRCWVAKSCLTLCDPVDYSPPGSPVHGISQARILEKVVISFSRGSSPFRDRTRICCIGRHTVEPTGKNTVLPCCWVHWGPPSSSWFW